MVVLMYLYLPIVPLTDLDNPPNLEEDASKFSDAIKAQLLVPLLAIL
jgi:hypothetical protein